MPAYRVVARNWATASENKIHDDAVARQYGFSGGLVPGVTLFAYMARPAAEAWGRQWLSGGTMSARFESPVYAGEVVEVGFDLDGEGATFGSLEVRSPNGACGAGRAGLDDAGPAPGVEDYPETAAPPYESRPVASDDALAEGTTLATASAGFHAGRALEYLAQIEDDLRLWQEGFAHPGWLLLFANQLLTTSVRLGPWIHVSSDVRMFRPVTDGETITARGRVVRQFERKGHRFVDLDVLLVADGRPAWQVTHTAIYSIRPAAGPTG